MITERMFEKNYKNTACRPKFRICNILKKIWKHAMPLFLSIGFEVLDHVQKYCAQLWTLQNAWKTMFCCSSVSFW